MEAHEKRHRCHRPNCSEREGFADATRSRLTRSTGVRNLSAVHMQTATVVRVEGGGSQEKRVLQVIWNGYIVIKTALPAKPTALSQLARPWSAQDLLYLANAKVNLHNRIFNTDAAASAMFVRPRAAPIALTYKVNITLSHGNYFYKCRNNRRTNLRSSQGQEVLSRLFKSRQVVRY